MEYFQRSAVFRCRQYMVPQTQRKRQRSAGRFPVRQFLPSAGIRYGRRPKARHKVCRAASGLGYPAAQPELAGRTSLDSEFQVQEYGAQFRSGVSVLSYRFEPLVVYFRKIVDYHCSIGLCLNFGSGQGSGYGYRLYAGSACSLHSGKRIFEDDAG